MEDFSKYKPNKNVVESFQKINELNIELDRIKESIKQEEERTHKLIVNDLIKTYKILPKNQFESESSETEFVKALCKSGEKMILVSKMFYNEDGETQVRTPAYLLYNCDPLSLDITSFESLMKRNL